SGTVPIRITAPGFAESTVNVTLGDTSFLFDSVVTPLSLVAGGSQTVRIVPGLIRGSVGLSQLVIRPGAPDIVVGLTSSDPDTVSVTPSQVIFKGGDASVSATIEARRAGEASVSLAPPPGFGAYPRQGLPVTVKLLPLSVFFSSAGLLGRDFQS